jgi:hypothetical protein
VIELPPLPKPFGHVRDGATEGDLFFQREPFAGMEALTHSTATVYRDWQLRAFAEEAVRLERERWEKVALRMVNGRLVGPTLCDVPPEVLAATSRKLMEDPEYRAKMLDLSARSQEGMSDN